MIKLPRTLSTALGPFLGLVYPANCALCHAPLPGDAVATGGLELCATCARLPRRLERPYCARCSEPLGPGVSAEEASPLCAPCADGRQWNLDGTICALRGTESAWDLVHALKYGRELHTARVLGHYFRTLVEDPRPGTPELSTFDAIIPVPLHPLRQRQRGFNQSALLAAELALAPGLRRVPMRPLLRRVRDTGTQTRLSREGRLQNLRGAFALAPRAERIVRGSRLLLVDDVLTTGSTVDECARILKRAGAAEVWAATVVRAGGD